MKRFARWSMGTMMTIALALGACSIAPTPLDEPVQSAKPTTNETSTTTDTTTEAPTTVEPVGQQDDVSAKTVSDEGYAAETEESMGMMSDTYSIGYSPGNDFNTEEYSAVEETGFVSTRTSPLSTISADVDTASYANLRRMLKDGYRVETPSKSEEGPEEDAKTGVKEGGEAEMPFPKDEYDDFVYDYVDAERVVPTGAVRIEEMLNYFDYDYPTPEGDAKFAITARMGTCPWNKDTDLLVLGYATGKEDEAIAKKGSNLVFLIDVSGSMDDDDKLDLLKDAFGELTKSLGENDRVSIVTYSGEEKIVLEGAKGSDRTQIMKEIRGLRADGSTNGEAGLRMAYTVAEQNFIEGGVNRIVMASDGDLNVGMSSESDLHDFVDQQREKGVYLSVLGFGSGNYKDNKMETLADHGNGSYHYIDSVLEAKRVFGDRLTANLVPFANDVKVQIEFNPAKIKGYRLVGYENRAMADEDFTNDEKDAGEVGPNSQFTVVYEVVRADSAFDVPVPELKYEQQSEQATNSNEWLTAKLRYQPASGGDTLEQELVVNEGMWAEDPGDDWRFAAAVSEFGMLLRDSEYKGTTTFDGIRTLVGTTTDELRVDFLDLVDMAETN